MARATALGERTVTATAMDTATATSSATHEGAGTYHIVCGRRVGGTGPPVA